MFAELQENDEELWAEARCKSGTGNLVALFYSEQLDDIARAKAICALCPVREAVLRDGPGPPGAVRRVGWPAVLQGQGARGQAAAGPSAQGPPGRRGERRHRPRMSA